VTKSVEVLNLPNEVPEVMRRAFSGLRLGRFGPVMVEIPVDVVGEEFTGNLAQYEPPKAAISSPDHDDVKRATKVLVDAKNPIILAGQGVLYAEASRELQELAELLQAPVMTTLEGKSAFPEDHPLALGTGTGVTTRPVVHFLNKSDVILAIGTSLTRHPMAIPLPPGKVIIHATSDPRDINKNYSCDYPILGDAKLVLRQLIEDVRFSAGATGRKNDTSITNEISHVREEWMKQWTPRLTSPTRPINPYHVIWEFMQCVDPREAIVTHDSGSPRNQMIPFYKAVLPRSYIGWGKSHALGTSLGLIMGAKLAAPEKFCVNFMGDAAFGMTGLDFETAARSQIPITTIVLNNSTMAVEKGTLVVSHERYGTRNISGEYAQIGKALGGHAERIENPEEIRSAINRAREANMNGKPSLIEFITSDESTVSEKQ